MTAAQRYWTLASASHQLSRPRYLECAVSLRTRDRRTLRYTVHSEKDCRVRIIAARGLGAGQRAGEGALEGVSVFLNKPYTAEKLLKTLAQVLKN